MTSFKRFFDRSGSHIENAAPAGSRGGEFGVATNPERFASLHEVASALLAQLTRDFDVVRSEGLDLDPTVMVASKLRTLVKLTPASDDAAPLVVGFNSFPGLSVRMGRWHLVHFPACGCDGCEESATNEAERFCENVQSLVAGHLQEAVEIRRFRPSRLTYRLRFMNGLHVGTKYVSRAEARAMAGNGPREFNWAPWRLRVISQTHS